MRVVIQRVEKASVTVDGELISQIGMGMMILICVETADTLEDLQWLTKKITSLRIFNDDKGVMNLDIKAIDGEIMAISQFTLVASTRKGNRPSYIRAAPPQEAIPMYDEFCSELAKLTGKEVKRGKFGADMKVSLTNDGPVTILIDSRIRE